MDLPASVLPWEPRAHKATSVERLQNDFVANAAHELKSPVASILALTGALRTAIHDDPDATQHFARKLEREAERLAVLASDLLDLSRLESGMGPRATVELDRVVETETERLRFSASRLGLRLHVDAGQGVWVSGSATDLGVLIHNLIDNAIRHTPEGGSVRVSVAGSGGWAELTVQDTGVGIADEEIDRVFERFYRASAPRSGKASGTGLGLALVRQVAEAHGGSVNVRSAVGTGSAFTVRLPLLERRTEAEGRSKLGRVDPLFEILRAEPRP